MLHEIFLMRLSRQGTSARLPPCPSQNRTSGFPSIRLFSIVSGQQRPIRVKSLCIRKPPLKMGNVCSPAVQYCGGLHSIGITRLHRYTGLHPKIVVLCLAPFLGCYGILRDGWPPFEEPSDPPGSFLVSLCCSMPSATPGRGIDRSSYRDRSCCLLQI